ncbi:MAG: hypothetical protein JWO15_352 [Sphingomonadales bacterium]|nr:hypothetical protein [Sphingomonadales bacterium]
MIEFANWLTATSLSRFLAGNALAFPLLEIAHVLAISLVLGTVFIFDLRLIGWSWRDWAAASLLNSLRPFALFGFLGAVLSGFLMFASQPVSYTNNVPFQIKLVLLGLAGLNLIVFHSGLGRSVEDWDAQNAVPLSARISALFSLLLWISILLAGRFVGFFLQG